MGIFSRGNKPPPGGTFPPPGHPQPAQAQQPARSPYIVARPVGSYKVDIVGERHYLPMIAKMVNKQEGEHYLVATLVREPKNKHDPNAVRVDVNGRTGGYIPSEDAVKYHRLLDTAQRVGCWVQAGCRVWYRGGSDELASIRLDMAEPAFAWPINPMASSSTVGIWPEGRALKVSLPDGPSSALQNILTRAYEPGACAAHLRIDNDPGSNRLTLSFDGQPVGTLSPAVSKQMRPVVEAAAQRGRTLFVVAEVTGNSLAAEVKARIAPADKLNEQQIRTMIG